MKMSEPKLSCSRIGTATGTHRNFVRNTIHRYNDPGLEQVLETKAKSGRPGKLIPFMERLDKSFGEKVPKTATEAASIVQNISGIQISPSRARQILHKLKYRYIKLQSMPGKADVEK